MCKISFFNMGFHIFITIKCIIDCFNEIFLVFFWIKWPGSSYNPDIIFFYLVTSHFECSEPVVYLQYWIKFIELSTHHRRFMRDIWLWKSLKSRAVHTKSRTSPKFCEERYYSYSRETSDSSLSEKFPETIIYWKISATHSLIISL